MKHMIQVAVSATVLAFSSLPAKAIDGYMRDGEVSGWNWIDKSRWTDAGGAPLGAFPQTTMDSAYLSCVSNNLRRAFFSPQEDLVDFGLARLVGGAMTCLEFFTPTKTTYPAQRLTISDPDRFSGWWSSYENRGNAEIVLAATDAHAPRLSAMSVSGFMGLSVPQQGTEASVDALFGDGALYSSGSGCLKIGLAPGSDCRLYATDGTVELSGIAAADQDVEALVRKAYLRLDASQQDTMTRFRKDGDEREYICRWTDANGGGVYAYTNVQDYAGASNIDKSDAPFVANKVSPTNLQLVDFGDMEIDPAHVDGRPVNGWMRLSEHIKAREVFYVEELVSASDIGGFPIGTATSQTSFRSYYNNTWLTAGAFPCVDFGDIRFNGQKAPYTGGWSTRYAADRCRLHVVSIGISEEFPEETADVSLLGTWAWDRNATGNVRLGEVLVYTNSLTASERTVINRYLMKKWLAGSTEDDFGQAVIGNGSTTASISVPEGRIARIGTISLVGNTLVKKGEGTLEVGAVTPTDATIDVQGGRVRLAAPSPVADDCPADHPYVWLDAERLDTIVSQRIDGVAHYAGDETQYVVRWNDCRAERSDRWAEVPAPGTWDELWTRDYSDVCWFPTNYPSLGSYNGHSVVDFGPLRCFVKNRVIVRGLFACPAGRRFSA